MSAVHSILVYLGLAQPQAEDGFAAPGRRGGQFSVCQTCGALVALESQSLHAQWHRGLPR